VEWFLFLSNEHRKSKSRQEGCPKRVKRVKREQSAPKLVVIKQEEAEEGFDFEVFMGLQ